MNKLLFKIQGEKKIKLIIILTAMISVIMAILILGVIYLKNQRFRKWIDIWVLQKNISTEDVTSIDLDTNKNNQIYCYNKYICILNEKNLKIYNSAGTNIKDISTNINTAIFSSCDKYLAIAESNGQEFCALYDKELLFSGKIERRDFKYLH